MNPGLAVKLRPTGPWRAGPDSGARDQVDPIYHNDSLYSAVCASMSALGMLEDWLEATARAAEPGVRFSSCFPFQGDTGYVIPPRTIWPPPASPKVRWKSARFVPLPVVNALLSGQLLEEDAWRVDAESECLVPAGGTGPFRTSIRSGAAVDRLSGNFDRHSTACLDFVRGGGLWMIVSFRDEEQQARWSPPVRAALRLLADSGFGGERSHGWGRSEEPEFVEGTLPGMILDSGTDDAADSYWLLSLYAPAAQDSVDWQRGNYCLVTRGGRIESPVRSGDVKKLLNMVSEGSVLFGDGVHGSAPDVAPDGFPHPAYRFGFPVAIPMAAQAAV